MKAIARASKQILTITILSLSFSAIVAAGPFEDAGAAFRQPNDVPGVHVRSLMTIETEIEVKRFADERLPAIGPAQIEDWIEIE